ncbi:MAG: hypothetical protein ACRBN8_41975 [Nannocystales bacterium]
MSGPASTKKTLLIVVASVLGFGLAAALGWGMLIGWSVDTEASDAQRGITGEHLSAYYEEPGLDGGTLEVIRTRYLDGSYDIAVDYEVGDVVVTSSLYSVERRASDALGVYSGLLLTAPLMETMADVELRDQDDLFDWGENSTSKVIVADGAPMGHVVIARKGKVAFMVTLIGVYEDDPQRLGALLQPVLDAAQADG